MSEEKKAKLRALNQRELEILNYLMEDKDVNIKEIAYALKKRESTIRNNLTGIYTKFEIQGKGYEKRANLIREYGDDYRELFLTVEGIQSPQEGIPATPSEASEATTNDQRINIHPPAPRINRSLIMVGILSGFLVISIVVVIILLNLIRVLNQPGQVPPAAVISTNTQRSLTRTTINTAVNPTATSMQIISTATNTKIPISTSIPIQIKTHIPSTSTPVPPPTPLITLPFSDDFSQGISPVWTVASGNWYTINNTLTIEFTDQATFKWIFINDPTLVNYRVKVTGQIFDMYSGGAGELKIIVRYDPTRKEQIGLAMDWNGYIHIDKITDLASIEFSPLTDRKAGKYTEKSTYVFEAKGNTFTAYVNGQLVGTISIAGFDKGGVGLGIDCEGHCPVFSGFSLEPLP